MRNILKNASVFFVSNCSFDLVLVFETLFHIQITRFFFLFSPTISLFFFLISFFFTDPPPRWEEVYERIKQVRSMRQAPIDTMGPEALSEKDTLPPPVSRFHCLVALLLNAQTPDELTAKAMANLKKLCGRNDFTPQDILQHSFEVFLILRSLHSCLSKVVDLFVEYLGKGIAYCYPSSGFSRS
jgi:hypothetical protein